MLTQRLLLTLPFPLTLPSPYIYPSLTYLSPCRVSGELRTPADAVVPAGELLHLHQHLQRVLHPLARSARRILLPLFRHARRKVNRARLTD